MREFLAFLPFVAVFLTALAVSLALTPVVRELSRRLGMVDKPDPRRINKVPIPRGGGVAVFVATAVAIVGYALFKDDTFFPGHPDSLVWKLLALSAAIVVLGLVDDRRSLPPLAKLSGQLVVAFLAWWWTDLGFADVWPSLPAWADCIFTVFWIVGAVNAFNLIDGLDGLSAGLALIAALGMAGAVMFVGIPRGALSFVAFAGALLGFLRYNYNPASVFLGDSGSMFIGFFLSTLPLATRAQNSFLVSVAVPLLAMGVPIFDTSLAILRRSIRRLLNRGDGASGRVMAADSDHLHHRILRSVGLNQRKAAWTLYVFAAFLVVAGLVGITLRSRAAGMWLFAVTVAAVVLFRDMARVELFDAGRLLQRVAKSRDTSVRRRWARAAIPFYLISDVLALVAVFFLCNWVLRLPVDRAVVRVGMPVRVIAVFGALVFFRAYVTVWSRAMLSNFIRLLAACVLGSLAGGIVIYYVPTAPSADLAAFTFAYAMTSFVAVLSVRIFRSTVRDFLYAADCSRLKARKDVTRVVVYGTGLRYRAFRRELVRTASANDRMIVGLVDDDLLLRGHYIGGLKVLGTLEQAPEIVNAVNADEFVVACDVSPEWLDIVRQTLAPTGVRVRVFRFIEEDA